MHGKSVTILKPMSILRELEFNNFIKIIPYLHTTLIKDIVFKQLKLIVFIVYSFLYL